jgi:NitT/TauT family transport system substrate-binding protein
MIMKKLLVILSLSILLMTGCKKNQEVRTIKIPLVTWCGYAALFAANNGAKPTEDSLFYKYGKFKVELVQEESSSNQLQGFANGTYDIIWSTMDMLPLSYDSLSKDPRTVPKVIGLFDYSAGGDGIIVRGNINNPSDLKGKKIVSSQFTPSNFFINWYLSQNGMTTKDVNMIYVADAVIAKDTFINDKSVDACVTWSPFIYDITDASKTSFVTGSKLLATSEVGEPVYGLIADVYLARADLVNEHPEIIRAFTKAMIDGYNIFIQNKEKTAEQIAGLFGLPKQDVMIWFDDVTIGGRDENRKFFDENDPDSAHKIFNLAVDLYKKNGNVLPESFNVDPKSVIASEFMMEAISQP